MIYCIDSSVIIWGIKKQASTGQEDMIARAENFFEKADKFNDEIIVPSIVLAEILAPEPVEARVRYLEIISKHFIVVDFESRAALKYAELMHGRFPDIKKLSEENNISRQKMKADHMIVAVAIVNNANCIYSTDSGLRTFGKEFIDIRELPPLKQNTLDGGALTQTKLFETENEKKDEETGKDDSPF